MKKHFYSHIVDDEPLVLELQDLDLEDYERDEIKKMIDSNLYHAILESIMDELSEEDKQIFLEHVSHDNHDKVWEHLKSRIQNIESKIKNTADTLMEELYKDIRDVKKEDSDA